MTGLHLINAQDLRPGDRIRYQGALHYVTRAAHCWGVDSRVFSSRGQEPYVELHLRSRRGDPAFVTYEFGQPVIVEQP